MKGEANSSRDLARRVALYLEMHEIPHRENLRVQVDGDTVTIEGRPGSQTAEWLCIACCRRVAGVRKVLRKVPR
jgi:osmotically-inducible protein OsmY